MYNSKLISILGKLDSNEKELLRKWVNSPAHNHREDRRLLFEYLLSKRKLTPFTTDRYKIYQLIYPLEKYEDTKFKKLMNLAMQLLENFIHFLSQKKDRFSKQKSIINFLGANDLDKYKEQYLLKTQRTIKKAVIQNSNFFNQRYLLEKAVFENKSATQNRSETNLQAIFDTQYLTFVLDTLYYACEAITHQRLYKSEYKIPLLQAILVDIGSGVYQNIPAIQLYYYSYMALSQSEKESYFEKLKELLNKYHEVLAPKELKSIYLMAINYCVQKLNNGIEKYVQTVFELYQYGLKHQILIENKVLSRFTYKNIVAAAIRLKEYVWVKQFIKNYTLFLEPIYRANYVCYANAKLHFAQHKYAACMELLLQVEFDNIFLNMDAKVMLLKIYYEQQKFDALDALLVSFRRFLQRKSVLAYQRNIHENMINLTTKLLNIPLCDKKKMALLRAEVESTNPLTEKPWLLLQLSKL